MSEVIRKEGRPHREESFNGIKFFAGAALPPRDSLLPLVRGVTAQQLREEKEVWRPEETVTAADTFFSQGKLLIEGPPQSGKGTILFGLSEICDIAGIGYCFINGHHQEVEGEELALQIKRANERNIPIFFDSFDYLFLKSRSVGRDIGREAQQKRVPIIIDALNSATVPIAITSHDEEWASVFLDKELRDQYTTFLQTFPRYQIPLFLQSRKSINKFLIDQEVPRIVVDYMGQMETDRRLAEYMQKVQIPNDLVLSALRTYPVLKELARDKKEQFLFVMEGVITSSDTDDGPLNSLVSLVEECENNRINLTQIRRDKKRRKIIN